MRLVQRSRRGAFTLIELLVVVAIIAVLLAILLPSLQSAREQAKAVKCASNGRSVGQAIHTYLAEERGIFPAAYQYHDTDDKIVLTPGGAPGGYLHWSYALFSGGAVDETAFQCPSIPDGGHPRTNPGTKDEDWELADGQVDQNGQAKPNPLLDKQAPRMAYTANAAIMPRNKFTQEMSFGPRVNQHVRDNQIKSPADVILVTEFNENWRSVAIVDGGGLLSKSHRPVNPFYHRTSGYDEYASLNQGFSYGPYRDPTYGLAPPNVLKDAVGLIDGARGTELNAVGRHHPGGDEWGGTANFIYTDGHVERKTVMQTMVAREWGDRYYSVTGDNVVVDRYGDLVTGGKP
jgi:prepilin-type N-terminal cleavage/methylation domain-containing protein/prepilin-type processing-associated H-X9-DG protein